MRACFMRLQWEDLAGRKCQRLRSPGATSTGLLVQKLDVGASRKKSRQSQKTAAQVFLSFWLGFSKPKESKILAALNRLLLLSPASNNSRQCGLSRLILDLNWEVIGRLKEGLLAKRRLLAVDFVHVKCQKASMLSDFWQAFFQQSSCRTDQVVGSPFLEVFKIQLNKARDDLI